MEITATPLGPNFPSHYHLRLVLHPRPHLHDRTGPALVRNVEGENGMSLAGVDVGLVHAVEVEVAAAVVQIAELHHVAENVG